MKRLLLSSAVLLMALQLAPAQDTAFRYNATGLEVKAPDQMKVLVEKLDPDAQAWGLNDKNIRSEIEEKLKSARITPLPEDDFSLPYRLYLEIQLLDTVFHLRVTFERVVSYRVGKKEFHTFASVFHRNSIGINSKKDGNHLLRILHTFLDDFVQAFAQANAEK